MTENPQAFPLQWPVGWRRADGRIASRFGSRARGISIAEGIERVMVELERLVIRRRDVVISTNIPLGANGYPKGQFSGSVADPGVAVYWRRQRESRCIAIDAYRDVGANLAAIAATLYAMRAIERHGGAQILDRVFQGFIALPAPEQWFQVLGVSCHATEGEIETAHRLLAMHQHPDRGGDTDTMARINRARDEGLAQLSGVST